MNDKQLLEVSIAKAEDELRSCELELSRTFGISNLHHNLFYWISGEIESYLYYDTTNPHYMSLRERALTISNGRAKEDDTLCRKYLNIDDMIKTFQEVAEDNSIYALILTNLLSGKLIRSAEILTYAALLLKKNGSTAGFEACQKINDERLPSEKIKQSVLQEMDIYREYITLCKEKLATLL